MNAPLCQTKPQKIQHDLTRPCPMEEDGVKRTDQGCILVSTNVV